MVRNFSAGYYIAQLNVCRYAGKKAVISQNWFENFQTNYCRTSPLVLKVKNQHLPVYGETSVPDATLALPSDVFESLDLKDYETQNVLLAKQNTVENIITATTDLAVEKNGVVSPE